jgi:hypothetical protein
MKKPNLIIVILILLHCQTTNLFGQNHISTPSKTFSYKVTQQDKQSYILSVGQPIKAKQDTFLYKMVPNNYKIRQEEQTYITVPVTFTNNSNDTLMYVSMSCSWWDIYITNNTATSILQSNEKCFKNSPVVMKIAPKSSSVVYLSIGFSKQLNNIIGVKIGMILQKYIGNKQEIYLPAWHKDNVIWSNEVFLPI